MADADSFTLEVGNCLGAAFVGADASDECDARAEPGAGERLVCALAAESLKKVLAVDGFARLRQFRSFDNEIGVRAADYDDVVFICSLLSHLCVPKMGWLTNSGKGKTAAVGDRSRSGVKLPMRPP